MSSGTLIMKDVVDFFCLNKLFLIKTLVRRNLKLKYRRSSLGFLWSLIVPLLTASTYLLLLKFVMRFEVPHYTFMLILGIITWSFVSVTSIDGLDTIFSNFTLMSKIPSRFHTFTFSTTITSFVNYLFSFPALVLFAYYDNLQITVHYVVVPIFLIFLFLIAYFMAVMLAILHVYFRDMRHLYGVFIQLWMYATPILYPPEMIPQNFKWLLVANPMSPIMIGLHNTMIKALWPPAEVYLACVMWVCIGFVASFSVYKKFRDIVLENV